MDMLFFILCIGHVPLEDDLPGDSTNKQEPWGIMVSPRHTVQEYPAIKRMGQQAERRMGRGPSDGAG